jgi:uncharacterized protein YdaU (DUF1376 family)
MAALPYMQLYVAEYLADTSHLNAAQHGAYLLLLMNYWQRGKALPDLNDRLATVARMSNDEWTANRGILSEFFCVENGLWIHSRVERDLVKVKGISNAGKIGGIASAKARKEKSLNDRSKTVERKVNQQNRTDKTTQENTNTLALTSDDVPAASPPVFTIKLTGKKTHIITQSDIESYREAYPGIDVIGELRKIPPWLDANPEKRSASINGSKKRIVKWLTWSQDNGRSNGNGGSNGTHQSQQRESRNDQILREALAKCDPEIEAVE